MDNLFIKYMSERTGRKKPRSPVMSGFGPVITISREYGCPGRRVAQLLSETLTSKTKRLGREVKWKWISKEIIEESARELKLSPELVQDLSDQRTSGFFDNLALFFSDKFYPGDVKVKNTIARFIYNAASEGNVVIVGRAGESITKNFKKALHVKLVAPLEWRTERISKTFGMSLSEAKREAMEVDKRRSQFRNYFEKNAPDVNFFDLFFNCATMSEEEIIEMILIVAETRGFI